MDKNDLELEQRVWERVSGLPAVNPPDSSMETMLQMNEESASVYRQLAVRSGGTRREKLMELYREAAASAQTLRGMMLLDGKTAGRCSSVPCQDSTPRALAKAFRRCCTLHRDYRERELQEDYGCVFACLAQREAESMALLLELIGE